MAVAGKNAAGKAGGARSSALAQRLLRHEAAVDRLLAIVGLAAFVLGTLPALQETHGAAFTTLCLIVSRALRRAVHPAPGHRTSHASVGDDRAGDHRPAGGGCRTAALLLGADAADARLFGVLWSLKLIRLNPAFALLARVLRNERQPLTSVMLAFVVVMLFAATLAFLAERDGQPEASAASRRRSGGR